MVNVMVNGATGKMGVLATKAIDNHPTLTLTGALSSKDNLKSALNTHKPDIVLDLTHASVVYDNTKTIIDANVRPVIGTSGLTESQIQEFSSQCQEQQLGGIIAPNFSIGAILMMQYAKMAAKHYSHAEIIEMHHDGKTDSPSGTALATAELIAPSLKQNSKASHETIPGARGANHNGIAIHAIRLPGLLAHQTVMFGGNGETFSLKHDTTNRDCFMPGITLACTKIVSENKLFVGLENFI